MLAFKRMLLIFLPALKNVDPSCQQLLKASIPQLQAYKLQLCSLVFPQFFLHMKFLLVLISLAFAIKILALTTFVAIIKCKFRDCA